MFKNLTTAFILTFFIFHCFGQTTLKIKIENSSHFFYLRFSSPYFDQDKSMQVFKSTEPNDFGFTTIVIPDKKLGFVKLFCSSDSSQKQQISYPLFISSNDSLVFEADFKKEGFDIKVTGKGSNNNQPFNNILSGFNSRLMFGDSHPNRILDSLKYYNDIHSKLLKKYISTYHPSSNFIAAMQTNNKYYAPSLYYSYSHENIFYLKDTILGIKKEWQQKEDSILSMVKLSNDTALITPEFQGLIFNFLVRKKEDLWRDYNDHPEDFLKEWYPGENGKENYLSDIQNILKEKIILKYLHHKTAEYAYAILFNDAFNYNRIENIIEIYYRFKNHFPNSVYINTYAPWISKINKIKTDSIAQKITIWGNGNNLNNLNAIHNKLTSKVGIIYTWGTWCSPCREEINDKIPTLIKYCENKNIELIFIAFQDEKNEKKWKELIQFLNLKGTHILANAALQSDINLKTNLPSVSSYIIMQKNGEVRLSDCGHPSDYTILYAEIEKALKRNN